MSLGAHGSVLAALGRHAEATRSFAEGARALRPLATRYGRVLAPLLQALCDGYVQAAREAGIEIDGDIAMP